MKDYLTEQLSKIIDNKIANFSRRTRFAIKKEIINDLLTSDSDTFNSVTLDTDNYLAYSPIYPNSVVVYKEGTSTYYQRYSDWTCDVANGTIQFLSTGNIVLGTNIVVEYKYYLSSLNDVPEIYGQKIMVKELIIKSGKGTVEVSEIRCSATASNYIKEEIILI